MTDHGERELLVMYKPDGADRPCADAEVSRALTAWVSVLRWLRGADPDELPEADLVAAVAQKAGLRMLRFQEYDIGLWGEQASRLNGRGDLTRSDVQTLPALGCALLTSIELLRTSVQRCWLNRVAIELLYGAAQSYQRHREILVPQLLDGPILMERWSGERCELAQAAKLLLRQALIVRRQGIGKLVHMEIAKRGEVDDVMQAVDVPR